MYTYTLKNLLHFLYYS